MERASTGLHPSIEPLEPSLAEALAELRRRLAAFPALRVAYSGGVDSTLVAAIAAEQLQGAAEAITGISPALAPHLREEAQLQARWLGLRHREIDTDELNDPAYGSNPSDRCYACKRELHSLLRRVAPGEIQVVDGVNADDLTDHRPGIRAAQELGVISPLAELGITKAGVRTLSRALGFPWWDKPAQPCLASRFPYGDPISASRLQRVAAAEAWLRQRGLAELRVRSQGETARIELPAHQIEDLWQTISRLELVEAFRALGFTAVGLDLEGLVSGKLNRDLAATPQDKAPAPDLRNRGQG